EAFAGVVAASIDERSLPMDVVNVTGGAIALGHPVAGTGLRLVHTLARELRRRGQGRGAAALCGGGGQGMAVVIEVTPGSDRVRRRDVNAAVWSWEDS